MIKNISLSFNLYSYIEYQSFRGLILEKTNIINWYIKMSVYLLNYKQLKFMLNETKYKMK